VTKQTATDLDLKIRTPHPASPVYMAWTNRDRHSTMYANVIPTEQYKLTNEELWRAASTSFGITNPVCLPHILRNQAVANRRRREGHAAADLSNSRRRDFSRRWPGRSRRVRVMAGHVRQRVRFPDEL
jgi:hypothetical protein